MQAKTYVDRLNEACQYVRTRIVERPDVGIILGSGLGSYGDVLTDAIRIPYKEIPQMLDTTVPGHSGCLIFGKVGDRKVLCLSGRSHQYEGLFPHEVQFSIRLLALCGCKLCLLTNAAGTRDPDLNVGDLAPMIDHINFTHRGYTEEPLAFKPFHHIIQTDMYDAAATKVAHDVAVEMNLQTKGCIYCYNFGPTYESHAEVEGQWNFGATNFGMSTVPEIIAMKDLGVPVFAMSFVTNKAAGISKVALSHEEVQTAAKNGEPNMRALISEVIKRTPLKDFPIPTIEGDSHIINRVLPEKFVSDEEIAETVKQFGETKIDAVIVLGACHTLQKLNILKSIDCNELPRFPILQHTSLKLNIGELNGHQIGVFEGFLNLNGAEEHALYYIIQLAKALGASTYIQTFSSGSYKVNGLAIVEDIITLFERPIKTPKLCRKPFDLSVSSLPHCILGSYHGPEFPSVAEAKGIERTGATHVTLGSVKGLLLANAAGLKPVGLSDGAYNGVLTEKDSLEQILASCRSSSAAVGDAISTIVGSIPKLTGAVSFNESAVKAIQWNDAAPEKQNEQEDPAKVKEIVDSLPEGIQFALVFQNESAYYNKIKGQLQTIVKVGGYNINSGELDGKKVILTLTSRELIRAFAQKGIKIIAISVAVPTDGKIAPQTTVCVVDHVNVTGRVPLIGHNKFGDRFPDMGHPYQLVKGLPTVVAFNAVDAAETTHAYGKAMRLFNADVAVNFGTEEAIIVKHSKGTIAHICVAVKCLCEEWSVDDNVLKNALQ